MKNIVTALLIVLIMLFSTGCTHTATDTPTKLIDNSAPNDNAINIEIAKPPTQIKEKT